MTHMRTKLTVAGLALACSLTYLVGAGIKSGWVYYLEVDQFATSTQYHSQRVRLRGKVAEDGIDARPVDLTAKFNIAGEAEQVPVVYHGVIPDMFKAGAEVVVEGKLDDAGIFQASVLMTKCASKYESDDESHRPDDHPATEG